MQDSERAFLAPYQIRHARFQPPRCAAAPLACGDDGVRSPREDCEPELSEVGRCRDENSDECIIGRVMTLDDGRTGYRLFCNVFEAECAQVGDGVGCTSTEGDARGASFTAPGCSEDPAPAARNACR